MNIDRLRMFISVADNLSFTKASAALFISQSALSRNISDLEKLLGGDLFERTTRNVSLTTVGGQFLIEARQIVNKYDKLMERVARLSSGMSGSLKLGYLELFTQNILPTAIKTFKNKSPLVEFSLREMTLLEVNQAIIDGEIDVGFIVNHSDPKPDSVLQRMPVVEGEIELIVSHDHPFAKYDIINPRALEKERIITFDQTETPSLRENITKMCVEHGFVPNFMESEHSPGAIFLLVQAGLGVSLLSSLITTVLRTERTISNIKLEGVHIPTRLELVWHEENRNPCIANFAEEVRKAVNPKTL